MTSFKYTAATLALLLTSGLAQSATTTTQPAQPMKTLSGADCPVAGSVAEDLIPAECKTEATGTTATTAQPESTTATTTELPQQDNAAPAVQPESTAATTTEVPKQDTATPAVQPESTAATTTEVPKQDTATPAVQPESTAATTTEVPKQDNVATTAADDPAAANVNMGNAVLASQFMGQTVYSTGNESVGEINDIVMNKELANVVAIIGVGGFLGIGEKDVAIPIDELTAVKDENNNLRLTIAATKEQLEAAPAFDRTALK